MRTVFRDSDHQASFERAGFVVVDLLDSPEVERLRKAYVGLEHQQRRDSPFAEGFHTTIYDDRSDYRRAVYDLIRTAFDRALAVHLVDYQTFFANFTVKMAGGERVPEHVDWTFVDETSGPSATVWCPLGAVDERNGALGVVPGSHQLVDFVRAVNHRHYERHAGVASAIPERLVLPLRAGQAVVMDNRVVHFSPPNDTTAERIAAAAVVAHRDDELHHYWVDDDGRLMRIVVSPEFYLSYRPGSPPLDVDGVLSVASAPGMRFA